MTDRMNVLQKENKILREEVTRQVNSIISIIKEADDKAEVGINSIVKELNYIIPSVMR